MAKKRFRPRGPGQGSSGPGGGPGPRRSGGGPMRSGRPGPRRRPGSGPGDMNRGGGDMNRGGEMHRGDSNRNDMNRGESNRNGSIRRRGPQSDRVGGENEFVEEGVEIEMIESVGLLEMHPNGYGFMRDPKNGYSRERSDPFVPGTMIEKYGLRPGVMLRGKVQPARRQQGPRLREILDVDGVAPDEYHNVKHFDQLTAVNPDYWFKLETGPQPITTRVMDLLTPLGKGQRALIVAPPRSGKTIMLQHISHGISENHPDCKLIVLLIDERPEEVTDMKRNVNGEVIASSLDEDIESHVRISQLIIERCKRLAEMGKDVFLLLDSITRLARAFNKWVGNTGRTMTGGVDIKAMDIPKKLFATARSFEEGGSLTIVGTALIDTGSRMDDLIFQEFKGTGNMELVLDRKLADRRVWPAIDISQSGTRREELLLEPETLHAVTMLRRTLASMHHVEAMEQLVKQLGRFKTNKEFITLISGKMAND
ncbi:MAG: transcription termination factor Rho [Pirellulaceae bacterium]